MCTSHSCHVQEFPVYRQRMPMQLLAYLRLARLTDSALLAKVGTAFFTINNDGGAWTVSANEYDHVSQSVSPAVSVLQTLARVRPRRVGTAQLSHALQASFCCCR